MFLGWFFVAVICANSTCMDRFFQRAARRKVMPTRTPARLACGRTVLFILLLVVLLGASGEAGASGPDSVQHRPQEVSVGVFLNRLSKVSHKDGTFDIDAWIWFRWKDGPYDPTKSFEVVNGQMQQVSPTELLNDGGWKYGSVRVQGTIFQNFDVHRYPLDNHRLSIMIEDSTHQATLLRYVVDEQSALDPQVGLEGWKAKFAGVKADTHSYPTTYGFRSLGEESSRFSRITFSIDLTRQHNFLSLLKLFWVSVLALMLAIGSCFVRSNDLDARFGLGLGAIFAASANTIAVSEQLPDTPFLTLAEQINMLTVLLIFLVIFVSIISLRLRYRGRDVAAERLDFSCAGVLSVAYPVLVALLLAFGL